MSELRISYARVSTDAQNVAAQREAFVTLGLNADRVYVDHSLTDTNRDRPRCARPSRPAEPPTSW